MWSALNKVSELLVNPDRRVIRIVALFFGLCALCRANYCYPTADMDSSLSAPYNWSVSNWSPPLLAGSDQIVSKELLTELEIKTDTPSD